MNTQTGHSGVSMTEKTWCTNTKNSNENWNTFHDNTYYYLSQLCRYENATSVCLHPMKTKVVNCFPSFLITWITSSSQISSAESRFNFFKCWQLSAIRRTVSPLIPCWKENISFDFNKRALVVVLISRYYKCNHCCSTKAIIIAYSEFVCL